MVGLVWDLLARDKASPAFGRLAGVIDKAAASQERFSSAQLEADRVANRLKIAELEVAAATERQAKVNASATATVERQATAQIGLIRANQGLTEAQAASAAAAVKSSRANTLAGKAATASAAATKNLTLPVVALAAASVYEAAKYQKSMTLISTVTDQTPQQLSSTSKGLLAIAKSTGTGLTQLTEGLYTVEKGGLRGAAALATVKAAAQGAKAENVDLGTATSALTSIMASYGSKLKDPVKAENELIRGAGLAKTTYADFASSLSNVVPIASSLGIGFDQIAGAVDTMTQHGETAQRATDNLGNLITNLAGQNNVASQSLQQLGVNTVDLSKNLGKRGLTGSLDTVLDAVAKNSKGGLVVTSTFKKAATATASVQTELKGMNGELLTQSKGFAAGKVSYKDYLAYTKSLGGEQYVLAKNFAGTVNQADGFNRALTSGNSTVRTTASTLQKALGGQTAARTALMLSGESAKTFKADTEAVGKAATATKGDVLGWANTQGTLSTKVDKAKASLQVMSVELGTALLPALSKLADEGEQAAHWADGLDSTQKKVVLWGLGTLAAIGPVMSIGARLALVGGGITRFTTGAVNQLARFNTGLATNAAGVQSAMSKVNAALGGAAIGLAVGELTKDSGTVTKTVGVIGSALAGAAIGFGAAGPMGAAIGGLAGGLTSAVTAFHLFGNGAKSAIKPTDAFTAAIQADNDVIGANTKLLTANSLQKSGAFDAGKKLNLSTSTVLGAATGNAADQDKVQAAIIKNAALTQYAYGGMTKAQKAASDAAKTLTTSLGDAVTTLKVNKAAADNIDSSLGKTKNSLTAVASSSSKTKLNLQDLGSTTVTPGVKVDAKQANTQIGALKQTINAIRQNKVPTVAAKSAGANAQIRLLQTEIDALRQGHEPAISVVDNASGTLNGIATKLYNLPKSKTIDIVTNVITNHATNTATPAKAGTAGGIIGGQADGGIIRGPGGPRADRAGIYALSNGEAVIPTRGVDKHRDLVDYLIAEGNGRAAGGVIGATSATTVYRVGKGWGFEGQYYGGKTGHKDALSARADYINGQRAAKLYHSPESRSTANTDMGSYSSAIASGDVSSVRSAYTTLYTDAKAAGANSAALTKLSRTEKTVIADLQKRTTITNQVTKATDYLTDLQSKASDLKTSVTSGFTGSFDITTAGQPFQDRAASADGILAQITADASKATAYNTLLQTLGKEGLNQTLLQQLAEAGPGAYDQAKALAETTPAKLAAINSQYTQLASSGSSAGSYVSGLVYGSKIDVAKALLNGYDPAKNPAMAKAVAALATSLYGAGKVSGVGLTHGLLGQKKAAGDAATKLGQTVAAQLRKSLGIHSPSRVTRELGRHTGVGFALGLEDTVARVTQASGLVGNAGAPSPAPTGQSSSGGGGTTTNHYHEWNITEANNGMDVHHQVMRRLALAGP